MRHYTDSGVLTCCATLVMRGTEVLDYETFGVMDVESGTPLRTDAIYRMYSNTKIVTSIAAMRLVESGRLSLDAPLSDYLPAFSDVEVLTPRAESVFDTEPAESPITIRQILSHSAGFSYGFIEPLSVIDAAYIAAGIAVLGESDQTLESLCDTLAELPLAYQPGTDWRYSLATDVTARVIEVVSGKRFDHFLEETIFEPLGMQDTAFWVPPEKRDRFIAMYAPTDLFDPMTTELVLADDPNSGTYTREPSLLMGGGGLVSTVADYLAFLRMIVNGGEWGGERIVTPETLRQMRTNQLAPGVEVRFPMWAMSGTRFGLGFALREDLQSDDHPNAQNEYFWGGMAGTHSWMAPQADLTGFCLTQRMPGFWHPFSHEFRSMTYALAGDV